MIPVTKSYFPPINDYISFIQRIYNNSWLTNRGELVQELENKLSDFLELQDSKIICMNNGTIPLQIALKLLGNGGEVITTPFSYVATTSAIVWENCTPVFVDIHPEYLTIDETKIEDAITEKTTCILATHVFGNPCNIEEIDRIAKKHNLKVIYDAAHCFGVNYNGISIFEYGDVSTCSFHATKLFHTGEGGAFFTNQQEIFNEAFYSHNFGHKGTLEFYGLGINGKMSELHAAMGLAVLPNVNYLIYKRKKIYDFYYNHLDSSKIQFLKLRENTDWNYSYFPILIENEETLIRIQHKLNLKNIFPRRYFFPSLNTLHFITKVRMGISENVSSRILCLPFYVDLNEKELMNIIEIINFNL